MANKKREHMILQNKAVLYQQDPMNMNFLRYVLDKKHSQDKLIIYSHKYFYPKTPNPFSVRRPGCLIF